MDNPDTGNPTYSGLKSNPGLHIESLMSNCLSHGTSVQLFWDAPLSPFSGKTGGKMNQYLTNTMGVRLQ